ncbi:Transcriptional repressor CTCFL [Amphibalanus amphitrite]|uniref:Transcriptional repressor CTCFL n=1 Tax=Amphibalanus amphitrite TaxID=1232801 RepID=A0A6A4W344_AMPAM|nr:Transcriptional repressor CTCFL [Amphibalanus amphitrite]
MGLQLDAVEPTEWNGLTAAGAQPFVCVHCDGLYKTERSLKNHFREHHTPNLTFRCADCGELCRRYIDLSRHRLYRCQFRKQPTRPPAKRAARGRRAGRGGRSAAAHRSAEEAAGGGGPAEGVTGGGRGIEEGPSEGGRGSAGAAVSDSGAPAPDLQPAAEPVPLPEPVEYDVLDSGDQCLPIDLASTSCDSLYGIDYTADKKKYNFELVPM